MSAKQQQFETPFETYTSTEILGEGGAGRVHLVTDRAGNTFALKCLSPERITSERLKRFKNEISFSQRIDHPNIVQVIDTGLAIIKNAKCPFYVMPRYRSTLRDLVGGLGGEDILRWFSQLLDGVEAAHLAGVWHRDLKPENILIDRTTNRLAVADFGIAHFEEEELYTAVETKAAARLANFQYSAPEQRVRDRKVDHRADIFALGLILNELFTKDIVQGSGHKKIADIDSSFSYLDDLVELMTRQDAGNRPGSILEIKKELIGRKMVFVARQEFDAAQKKVVKSEDPPLFESIEILNADYQNGILLLKLNRNVPPGWAEAFRNPRGNISWTMGYAPENYDVRGNTLTIQLRGGGDAQTAVDHAKRWVARANTGYVALITEQLRANEQRMRTELERKTQEAERRKNILANLKV